MATKKILQKEAMPGNKREVIVRRFLPLLILSLALMACKGTIATPIPTPETTPSLVDQPGIFTPETLTSAPGPLSKKFVQPTASYTPKITPTSKITPVTTFSEINLVHPIYLLAGKDWNEGQDLYKIIPGSRTVEHLNPAGEEVTCFDVWNDGERLAFGTKLGKIYTRSKDDQPQVILDTSLNSAYPTLIKSISWSPDGKQLAYAVDLRGDYEPYKLSYPTRPSGIWVVDIRGKNPIWLISNNYLPPGAVGVADYRSFNDPIWSPDGTALIVHDWHWEGDERVWFDPIKPVKDDRSLIRYGGAWSEATWTLDSQGVLLSGLGYSDESSLVWISRNGKEDKVLIDGEKNELYIENVLVFQDRLYFIAMEGFAERKGRFLYDASIKDNPIKWSKSTPDPICPLNGILSSAKGPGDNQISLLCGLDLQIISSASNSIDHIDLTSLRKDIKAPIISMKWGKEK